MPAALAILLFVALTVAAPPTPVLACGPQAAAPAQAAGPMAEGCCCAEGRPMRSEAATCSRPAAPRSAAAQGKRGQASSMCACAAGPARPDAPLPRQDDTAGAKRLAPTQRAPQSLQAAPASSVAAHPVRQLRAPASCGQRRCAELSVWRT